MLTCDLDCRPLKVRLTPDETELIGDWIVKGSNVVGDETQERISWLIGNVLEEMAISIPFGAWETLFRDPEDGRLWELAYPQGEMHGGGPQALRCISEEIARQKYKF
jgi:hypothetical protein